MVIEKRDALNHSLIAVYQTLAEATKANPDEGRSAIYNQCLRNSPIYKGIKLYYYRYAGAPRPRCQVIEVYDWNTMELIAVDNNIKAMSRHFKMTYTSVCNQLRRHKNCNHPREWNGAPPRSGYWFRREYV